CYGLPMAPISNGEYSNSQLRFHPPCFQPTRSSWSIGEFQTLKGISTSLEENRLCHKKHLMVSASATINRLQLTVHDFMILRTTESGTTSDAPRALTNRPE